MRAGEVIGARFRIAARAGAGGMGVVYRAEDLETHEPVAIKVIHPDGRPERFLREASVLAEISHPAVVRYVAHGVTHKGEVYLAMEWLDGQPLSRHLADRRLDPGESLVLLRRLLQGLAEAHDKGVVHRDLKPGNVLVPEQGLGSAKLIDFGVARRRLDPRITERGLLVGTVAYMSPEQARGSSDVAPASDVFSLGSVVYKCLSGRPPFVAADPTAVLAKVLLDDPTPLGEVVEGIPHGLDSLVLRMLRKQPEHRPRDAREVLELVEQLGAEVADDPSTSPGITSRERRLVWVVLMAGPPQEATETREARASQIEIDPAEQIAATVAGLGGRYDVLADGTRVASFVGSGVPRDHALRASHCAALMRELFPGRGVVVASGMGTIGTRAPMGGAIDLGTQMLARARPDRIQIDEATARLIGTRYEVPSDGQDLFLGPERNESDASQRLLLGRPTRCVGRDRELETLCALLDECVAEPVARVALITAPAGYGKSRLRYEFLRRAHKDHPEVHVLFGRADSVSAGSPFAMLRQALRRSAGVLEGEPFETQQRKLAERVRRTAEAPESKIRELVAFLGELAGVPFPDDACETLAAARQNPTLLGDSMRGAWLDFLGHECRAHPVVLVLEDLHWGDVPTTSFVDAALSTLGEAPFLVVALARPEVHDAFPGLWRRREPQEVRLGRLRRPACETLVRDVLGTRVNDALVGRMVELADGNAFFLEELIRAIADGRDALPETLIGMMQSRLEALGAEARRVLRAASVFGAQFWRGGVQAVLGSDFDPGFLARELDDLVRAELVTRRDQATFEGETEYTFRHATLRETVYATLTPDDRALAHRLAAQWLEQLGAADAVAMAAHFRSAGLPDRAARWYLQAAEQALEGTDLAAAVERVALALECNPDRPTRGALHYLAADAHFWRGEYVEAEAHARQAIDLLEPGAPRWFVSIGALCSAAFTVGHHEEMVSLAERAAHTPATSEEARACQIVGLVRATHGHLKLGRMDDASALIERAGQVAEQLTTLRTLGDAWVHHARSARAYYAGDVGTFVREVEASIRGFDEVGDGRTGCNARANLGYAALSIGDLERAEPLLREALALTERLGMAGIGHYVMHNLGLVLAQAGKGEEGLRYERKALDEAVRRNETLLIGGSHLYLALILLGMGRAGEALAEARLAFDASETVPMMRAQAKAVEADVHRTQGRPAEALDAALAAEELLALHGGPDEATGRVQAALADALSAAEQPARAAEIAFAAEARLLELSKKLGDERLERLFLERVPEHARIRELAARCRGTTLTPPPALGADG